MQSGVNLKREVQVSSVKKSEEGVEVTLDSGEVLPPADVLLWAVRRFLHIKY